LARPSIGELAEPNERDEFIDPSLLDRAPGEVKRQGDIFANGEPRQQGVVLKGDAQFMACDERRRRP
jgi:hypothetical protein